MLTRDKLTAIQWQAVRNTPHHVIIAVSSSGGSPFDEMLERAAGLQAIVDAINATHPLVSEIAGSTHIMHAQDEVRQWYYTLDEHASDRGKAAGKGARDGEARARGARHPRLGGRPDALRRVRHVAGDARGTGREGRRRARHRRRTGERAGTPVHRAPRPDRAGTPPCAERAHCGTHGQASPRRGRGRGSSSPMGLRPSPPPWRASCGGRPRGTRPGPAAAGSRRRRSPGT